MAFVGKVGNMLKQTISNCVKLELGISKPSIYQAMRCMSSSKVFVGGIPFSTDEMSLREAFAQYGEVVEARIVTDRDTGRSRGFGFVSYTSSDEASGAIQALDGKDFQGRMLRVNYATERSTTGGGFGYSGGNYGVGGNYGGGGTSYDRNYGGGGGGGGYGGSNYGNSGGISSSYGATSNFDAGNSGGYGGGSSFDGRETGGKEGVDVENNKDNNNEVDDYANTRG